MPYALVWRKGSPSVEWSDYNFDHDLGKRQGIGLWIRVALSKKKGMDGRTKVDADSLGLGDGLGQVISGGGRRYH